MEEFPLTANGKVDKKALPEPDRLKLASGAPYVAPRNEIESKLAKSWSEALENIKIGIDDNLFNLGGDSLTIIEILSDTLPFNWGISAQDFYEYPTVRLLAGKIQGSPENKQLQPEKRRAALLRG
jgi:acyl carrier protein